MDEPPPDAAGWSRADWAACLACAVVGVTLAVAPHLAAWAAFGTLEFLADGDDIAYLSISRAPYHGEWALRDPFSGRWEGAPCYYPWALFVPWAKLARVAGLPLILTGVVWRVVGGALLGWSLYFLLRRLLAGLRRPILWASGGALICLSDAGFIGGRSFIADLAMLAHLWSGTTPFTKADALAQFRVVNPLLNLPFFLFAIGAVAPSRAPFWRSAAIGIIGLGMCVLLSFYMWTAATLTLGMWGLVQLVRTLRRGDAEARRRFGLVAVILVGGLTIGAPQTYSNARTFSDPLYKPIMMRATKGVPLPPGDPARGKSLRNYWVWGKLAVGLAAIVGLGLARLTPVWLATLAGYALSNSALVTGLDFENTHWVYVYSPMGEVLLLVTVATVADRWREAGPLVLGLGTVALVATALVWRPFEALHAPEAVTNRRLLDEFRPLRPVLAALGPDRALVGPPEAKVALLSSRCALLYHYQYSWNMSLVPDAVVHEKHALSGWLRGQTREDYLVDAATDRNVVYMRPEYESRTLVRRRGAIFDALERGEGADLLAKYRPGYLITRTSEPAPSRAGPWVLLGQASQWSLWERRPTSPP